MTDTNVRDVLQRVARAKSFTKDWYDNIEKYRRYYGQNHYDKRARKGEIQYNDPTYTNTVDLAVGIMRANDFMFHAFGQDVSDEEERQTGDIEKLLDGSIHINSLRNETDIKYDLTMSIVRDGGAVLYSVFDPQLAEDREVMTVPDPNSESGMKAMWLLKQVPIRMQVIDAAKFFALPGGPNKWLMVGRVEKMSVLDVETLYSVKLEKFAGNSDEQKSLIKGEFIDAWDYVMEDGKQVIRNTVLFDRTPIRGPQIMSGYKELPYTVQFYKPTGDSSGEWKSIIAPLESTVSNLERTVNRRAMQVDMYTSLPLVSKTQGGRPVQIDANLFQHVQLNPDESLEFPTWPGNAPDVQNHMEFLRSRIQQSGFSDVMFGGGVGQIAGYALSQLGDQNRIRLTQPIKHLELLLTIWAYKTLSLLSQFAAGEAICVYGHRKGRDYNDKIEVSNFDGYAVRAEIRPNFPNERQRKVAMATQVKGILSEYTVMEQYLDIEQPEDEWERKVIELATKDPVVMRYTLLKELQKRASGGDEIATLVIRQMQNESIPTNQPGRPSAPNSPEQPTGLQSSTGLATPQESGMEPAGQSEADQLNAAANQGVNYTS